MMKRTNNVDTNSTRYIVCGALGEHAPKTAKQCAADGCASCTRYLARPATPPPVDIDSIVLIF